jgi:two-component system, LytTR family, response regulator
MSIPPWRIPLQSEGDRRSGADPGPFAAAEARQPILVRGVNAGAAKGVSGTGPKYLNRMSIRAGDRIVLIAVQDIVWVQSHGNVLRLYLHHASYEHRMTMKELCQQLDPETFVRVHRNAIVNLDHVVEFELPRCGNAVVRLRNGKTLPISGSARVALRRGLLTRPYSSIGSNDF